ncbi:MAG: hypothetical protein AAGF89_00355 [Bacteroidota bacterium]
MPHPPLKELLTIGVFIVLPFLFFSCGPPEQMTLNTDITRRVQLERESIFLEMPENYLRTNKGRYQQDLANLLLDSVQQAQFDGILSSMEFQDAEIDIFYDTISKFNWVIILNVPEMPLNKQSATVFANYLDSQYGSLAGDSLLIVEKITSSINSSEGKTIAQFKYKFTNHHNGNQPPYYLTSYLVKDRGYSVVAHEMHLREENLYPILWSLHTR